MSRHRGHPRATLSTITPLQSLWKDIIRQHFVKFYHSHPERSTLLILNNLPVILYRPTPSSRTWSSRTLHPFIPSLPPLHPELIPFLRLQLSGEHVCVRSRNTIYCPALFLKTLAYRPTSMLSNPKHPHCRRHTSKRKIMAKGFISPRIFDCPDPDIICRQHHLSLSMMTQKEAEPMEVKILRNSCRRKAIRQEGLEVWRRNYNFSDISSGQETW